MKRVVLNCLARGDQKGYVLFRRWIIEHPVAGRRELIEVRRKLPDPDLRDLFDEAYEVVPTSTTAGSGVRTCGDADGRSCRTRTGKRGDVFSVGAENWRDFYPTYIPTITPRIRICTGCDADWRVTPHFPENLR